MTQNKLKYYFRRTCLYAFGIFIVAPYLLPFLIIGFSSSMLGYFFLYMSRLFYKLDSRIANFLWKTTAPILEKMQKWAFKEEKL